MDKDRGQGAVYRDQGLGKKRQQAVDRDRGQGSEVRGAVYIVIIIVLVNLIVFRQDLEDEQDQGFKASVVRQVPIMRLRL
jgi:hypothetical protein